MPQTIDLHINVTQAHIGQGVRGDCELCVITLALQDAVERAYPATYQHCETSADDVFVVLQLTPKTAIQAWTMLPGAIIDYIEDFDLGRQVSPIAFDLHLISDT